MKRPEVVITEITEHATIIIDRTKLRQGLARHREKLLSICGEEGKKANHKRKIPLCDCF